MIVVDNYKANYQIKLVTFFSFLSQGGDNFINFVHLYFTIATEIGIFHDLAPLCFSALKEAMFSGEKCYPTEYFTIQGLGISPSPD